MFEVSPEDLLRGLKRFKRLAKQDLLASSKTPNPRYWTLQAEARRKTYDLLMERIQAGGLEDAYETARHSYLTLPLNASEPDQQAQLKGQEQALELFFGMLGLNEQTVQSLRQERRERQRAGNTSYAVNAR